MELDIISLNIWHGGKLWPELIEFLKAHPADALLLQEAYHSADETLDRQFRSTTALAQELGYKYYDFTPSYLDFDRAGGKAETGNAILARYPLTAHPPVYFDIPYSTTYRDVDGQYQFSPRNLQRATMTTPGGTVELFNLHGVWDLNGDNFSPQRERMAKETLVATAGLSNMVLAGDTNAKASNQALKMIEAHLPSVFGESLTSTFNMRRKDNPGYATAAVDAMFVSPGVEILSKDCPDVDISDHLPLVTRLRF